MSTRGAPKVRSVSPAKQPAFSALIAAIGVPEGEPDDGLALAGSIRDGLSAKSWEALRNIGFTAPELATVIGVSEKTLSRKQRGSEPLDIVEGDRTVRLTQIVRHAARAFDDVSKALQWLRKPNRLLAGQRPIDVIATEPGVRLVERLLGSIEFGGLA